MESRKADENKTMNMKRMEDEEKKTRNGKQERTLKNEKKETN
jgi:hypothetical protein